MRMYDVIVIGGGHAGCEAAAAAARMGAKVLLATHRIDTIGEMSCNPAIGGLGKGHLVREIDALDGLMGRVADIAGIQFRLLNRRKGPAVRGPRAQSDRRRYREGMQALLRRREGLTLESVAVDDLVVEKGRVGGIVTASGETIQAGAVVLTTGTFLRGIIHCGPEQTPAGRAGEAPAIALADRLHRLGLRLGRLKTGTPPRLDARSIDWAGLQHQPGDDPPTPFSFLTDEVRNPGVFCHITHTNERVHALIRDNLDRAPIYSGQIESHGPRYCPSIEDKVVRFADKARHQIFLEPEGLDDLTIYPNGISTSLPAEVQAEMVRSIEGLSRARIIRPGYAIEYDFVDPRELTAGLQVRACPGLFLAGQINGTTGYEEAAGQGLLAGLNAARWAGGRVDPFVLDRGDAYLGVMIDDLVTKGVNEPYRMFTSRAEFRLLLRADNADQRLTAKGEALGCVGADRARRYREKADALSRLRARMADLTLTPSQAAQAGLRVNLDGRRRTAQELLALPEVDYSRLCSLWPELAGYGAEVRDQVEIDAHYAGYLDRQQADVAAFRRDESRAIPNDFDYGALGGLSNELREKLELHRPATLGAAGRIPGMTPSALSLILAGLLRRHRNAA